MSKALKLNQPFFELVGELEYDSIGRIFDAIMEGASHSEMPDEVSLCCENLSDMERAIVYLLCREIIDGVPAVSAVEG